MEKTFLKNKIISGSFWIILLEIGNQALQFFKTFYAAKLLSPADFGIVGLAFLVIAFMEILSTTGMKEAIIQKQNDVTPYLDTIWTIELIKGIIGCILLYFSSSLLVKIIHPENAELTTNVIKFIGFIFFLQCSTNVGVLFFEKDIQFKKFFKFQFSGTIADVLVSVVLISYMKNVWALFYGVLAGNLVRVIFSFLLSNYKPKLYIDFGKARELYKYGKWIFGGRLFSFVGLQADSIIVSSFYGLYSLGIYQMAFRIGNLPMSQVSNLIGRIAFPTFSKLSEETESLKKFFLTSFSLIIVVLMPIIILVLGLIHDFTILFLGSKWISIVPVVKILIISGLLRIFVSLIDSLFMAVGSSKYSSLIQSSRFFIFIFLVFPLGFFWGITGIALSGLISLVLVFLFFLRIVALRLGINWQDLKVNIVFPVAYGLLVVFLLFVVKYFYNKENISVFAAFILCTLTFYTLVGLALDKYTGFKLFHKPLSILKSYKVAK